MRKYEIRVDIYNASLLVCIGSADSYYTFLRGVHGDEVADEMATTTSVGKFTRVSDNECISYYVWVESFDWTIKEQGILLHEILHFVNALFCDIGMPVVVDTEEPFAYLLQYVFSETWSKIIRYDGKNKKAA